MTVCGGRSLTVGRLQVFEKVPAERTAGTQGGYQVAAMAMTLLLSISGGAITGFIMTMKIWGQPSKSEHFSDLSYFEVCICSVVTVGLPFCVSFAAQVPHEEDVEQAGDVEMEEGVVSVT